MYKLIFADDEALVRNNIAKLIDWNKCGFELIECCANGHELLEAVEKETPDLVITDINMPFLTGIEAAQRIKRDFPTVKIAFLTGYNDFNYAQKAIDLKVVKYILKPVTVDGMVSALGEIKEILDNEYVLHANINQMEEFYKQNLPMIQSIILNDMLIGSISEKESEKRLSLLDQKFASAQSFQTAVIMSDRISEGNDFWDESEELINFAIYNISKEIIEANNIGTVIFSDKKVTAIARYYNQEKQMNIFSNCLEEIRCNIEKHLQFTVTIGKGCVYPHFSKLHISFDEALAALSYKSFIGGNRIIYIKDIEPQRRSTVAFDKNIEMQLLSAIKLGDTKEIKQIVDLIFENITKERGGVVQHQFCSFSILLSILREAEYIGVDTSNIVTQSDLKSIFEMWDVDEMKPKVMCCAEKLSKCIVQSRKNSCSAAIEKAKTYISENYKNPDLSVDTVSESLHLSASYFRALFKKEIRSTFGSYLTELRMEKAKDLILTTSLKNYEIATQIGYSDPHYFSYCFKKYFKKSPNELRESLMSDKQ